MAHPEIIDLCSDDTVPHSPTNQCSIEKHALGSIFRSNNAKVTLEDDWLGKPAKRGRISPSPLPEDHVEAFSPVEKITARRRSRVVRSASTNLSKPTTTRTRPIQDSDPIVFTSSLDDGLFTTKIYPRRSKNSSPLSDDLDEIIRERLPPPTSRPPPKLDSQLSGRTAALLANLSGNKQPLAEGEASSSGHSMKSRKSQFKRLSKRESATFVSCPIRHEDVEPTVPDVLNRTERAKLTEAEKEVRAQEREQSRLLERERKTKRKEEEKEKKKESKERKAREKEAASILAEVNKARTDKKISTPEMIVDLPLSMAETTLGKSIRGFLKDLQVNSTSYDSPISNVVKWRRRVTAHFNEELGHWEPIPESIRDEKYILRIITAKEFVELVEGNGAEADGQDLNAHILKLNTEFQASTQMYLIEGLTTWMKRNKNVRNRAYQAAVLSQVNNPSVDGTAPTQQSISRRKKPAQEYVDEDMIEDALLRLQVMHGCLIHHTTTAIDTAEWVANFTQHISTIPYRSQRMNLETSFCMDVGQVKTGNDRSDTYVKMLQEIVRVTAPIAYGIVAEYPSVGSLIRGLQERGPTALEDLKKSANKNGAFTDARIGPAISKRIYKVFLGIDPTSTDV
ncbi:MAG: hypothetical protein M1827_002535 [Pycnora praestabilis]|nr:MAG: hypothetical protein M1827_002535 [Pycnora praestabilis]